LSIFRHISRIARGPSLVIVYYLNPYTLAVAAIEVAIVKKSGGLIKHGLEVLV